MDGARNRKTPPPNDIVSMRNNKSEWTTRVVKIGGRGHYDKKNY